MGQVDANNDDTTRRSTVSCSHAAWVTAARESRFEESMRDNCGTCAPPQWHSRPGTSPGAHAGHEHCNTATLRPIQSPPPGSAYRQARTPPARNRPHHACSGGGDGGASNDVRCPYSSVSRSSRTSRGFCSYALAQGWPGSRYRLLLRHCSWPAAVEGGRARTIVHRGSCLRVKRCSISARTPALTICRGGIW